MSRFLLLLQHANRPITYVELIASMQLTSEAPCGPVYADGIDGYRYQVAISAFEDPVRFLDRRSALNAIQHLGKDMAVEESSFRILPCEA